MESLQYDILVSTVANTVIQMSAVVGDPRSHPFITRNNGTVMLIRRKLQLNEYVERQQLIRLPNGALLYVHAKTNLYLVHHNMCIKLFYIGIIHQIFFRKFFIMLHVFSIYNYDKVIRACYIITLHYFGGS